MVAGGAALSETQHRLIRALASGDTVSGAELARVLGVSRTAVWNRLRRLAAFGVEVAAVRGRGYRLAAPLELLDRDSILAGLAPEVAARIGAFHLPFAVDSTNAALLRLPVSPQPRICLAEHQSAGRGRRGRVWQSPLGAQIPLSIGYCFATLPADFAGLGLAVGVMVAQALLRLGVQDIGLKWPNDLLWEGRKLGGVLIELRGEAGGPCDVVVGVGVNVQLPDLPAGLIDQPWTDLGRILGTNRPHRNRVAEALIGALIPGLDRFAEEGLAPFLPHFRERDVLAGRRIRVEQRGDWLEGTARGVSERGALLLEDAAGIRPYWSGEICVRALDP